MRTKLPKGTLATVATTLVPTRPLVTERPHVTSTSTPSVVDVLPYGPPPAEAAGANQQLITVITAIRSANLARQGCEPVIVREEFFMRPD